MDRSRKPKISNSYTAETFGDELLLYSKTDERALYLNITAQAVLQLCDDDLNVAQIIDRLQHHYPDQRKEIDQEVIEVLSTLESNGVITFEDE
jgi:coenzyme PQQ biosynthesis protein PqqD